MLQGDVCGHDNVAGLRFKPKLTTGVENLNCHSIFRSWDCASGQD